MGPLTRRINPFSRETLFLQSSKRSSAPGWQAGSGSRPNETDNTSFASRLTYLSRGPSGGCHVVLEPLHEPLTRARINKKEQT